MYLFQRNEFLQVQKGGRSKPGHHGTCNCAQPLTGFLFSVTSFMVFKDKFREIPDLWKLVKDESVNDGTVVSKSGGNWINISRKLQRDFVVCDVHVQIFAGGGILNISLMFQTKFIFTPIKNSGLHPPTPWTFLKITRLFTFFMTNNMLRMVKYSMFKHWMGISLKSLRLLTSTHLPTV